MGKKHKPQKAFQLDTHLDTYAFWLIAITIGLIPLLIRIVPVEFSTTDFVWDTGQTLTYDTYSYIKANAIKIVGILSCILLGLKLFYKQVKSFRDIIPLTMLVSMVIVIFATLSAFNTTVAFNGFIERYEGMWVLLSYGVIFLLAYSVQWEQKRINTLFNVFWVTNIILSLIGLGQAFGHDIFLSEALRPLLTSFKIDQQIAMVKTYGDTNFVSQTLYHYNYVGFFITLSFPVFLSMALYQKSLKLRIMYALTALLILFNLFASTARGGMVGLIVGMVVFLIFNRNLIIKNSKAVAILLIVGIMCFGAVEAFSGGLVSSRIKQIFASNDTAYQLQGIAIDDDIIKVSVTGGELDIIVRSQTENSWDFDFTFNGEPIKYGGINDESKMYFDQPELHDMFVFYTVYDDGQYHLTLQAENVMWPFNYIDGKLMYRNAYGNYEALNDVDSAAFLAGHENLGSARGYIWSRALPLISDHALLGYGPDNFALIFPQNDYIGKLHVYQTTNMVVDKAHNLYLQITLSTGILSLICFLVLIVVLLVRWFKRLYQNAFVFSDVYESALMVAMASYFTAALFNDSTVHVSPVFWVFFGIILSYLKSKTGAANPK
ncbi:O-antigen ligase family protein [Fusibacter paucivorans]|uniref:O-antigen ligase family protein n=1 Tax=Fusibacter paucivorans TaxID=76009 RepID=A0ABS5PN39_9FIRM|nr:O-antigen ligase family protein [Fusibacter paucivorans]MBS7526598.1 O-antigen ligase family protein [Fusibacter paucivorans]